MASDLTQLTKPVLPSTEGRQLTELQQTIADLVLTDKGLTPYEIAEQAGCEKSNVYKVLAKQHVREYILRNVNTELMMSAPKALSTQASLLNSKSDYIRNKAASDLLDRNEIGTSNAIIGQAVQVKIDLS
jgi:predicted transcriptional regulator